MKIKISFIIFLYIFISLPALADWPLEQRKIEFLLQEIARLDAVFIRNGAEHTPKEATNHLRRKLKNAQRSWFSPDLDEWTAEMFIEKIASKSSISGKLYLIKFENGETTFAGIWLKKTLDRWTP